MSKEAGTLGDMILCRKEIRSKQKRKTKGFRKDVGLTPLQLDRALRWEQAGRNYERWRRRYRRLVIGWTVHDKVLRTIDSMLTSFLSTGIYDYLPTSTGREEIKPGVENGIRRTTGRRVGHHVLGFPKITPSLPLKV